MNTMELRGQWGMMCGIMKQTLSRITHNEQQYAEGRFEEIAGRMQVRTGETYRRLKISTGVFARK